MASAIDPTLPAAGVPAERRTGGSSVVSGARDAVDVYAFLTRDAGAGWYGFPGGKGST